MIWRLLVDPRLSVASPRDLEAGFTFSEGMQAHDILDAIDDAERRAAERARGK